MSMELTNSKFRHIAAVVSVILFILFVPLLSENRSGQETDKQDIVQCDTLTLMEDSLDAGVFY